MKGLFTQRENLAMCDKLMGRSVSNTVYFCRLDLIKNVEVKAFMSYLYSLVRMGFLKQILDKFSLINESKVNW